MKLLFFLATYNEDENIKELIIDINNLNYNNDILIIDDSPNEKTRDIIYNLQKYHSNIIFKKRKNKLGIASAHKYAFIYAIANNYDLLLTMDADYSHQPNSIHDLMKAYEPNSFVTGSRYCIGGRCDYEGYRKYISYFGNLIGKLCLNIEIDEITTLFRIFDVTILSKIPLRLLPYCSYSFGYYVVYFLDKHKASLFEVPIHFIDRKSGYSKISKHEIFTSVFDLGLLVVRRLFVSDENTCYQIFDNKCGVCGEIALIERFNVKYIQKRVLDKELTDDKTIGLLTYYKCLHCWHDQSSLDQISRDENLFDIEYYDNIYRRMKNLDTNQLNKIINKSVSSYKKPIKLLQIQSKSNTSSDSDLLSEFLFEKFNPSAIFDHFQFRFNDISSLNDNFNYHSQKYYLCYSDGVINSFMKPLKLFSYVNKILDKDGYFIFFAIEYNSVYLKYFIRSLVYFFGFPSHFFTEDHIKFMLEEQGFCIEAFVNCKYTLPIDFVMSKLIKYLPEKLAKYCLYLISLIPKYFTLPLPAAHKKLYIVKKIT